MITSKKNSVWSFFVQCAVRLGLITVHWIKITELLKSPLIQNNVKGKTPGLFGTVSIWNPVIKTIQWKGIKKWIGIWVHYRKGYNFVTSFIFTKYTFSWQWQPQDYELLTNEQLNDNGLNWLALVTVLLTYICKEVCTWNTRLSNANNPKTIYI